MSSLARPGDPRPTPQYAHDFGLVQLRAIGIDDWSDVRHLHGSSFRTIIGPHVPPGHVEDFLSSVATPEYVDRFRASNLTGAWIGRELAGTVGWRPSASQGRVARIEGLFVQPLFTFMGLGSQLLAHAEAEACRAGFSVVTVLAPQVTVPFFMRLGYDIYVQGAGLGHGPAGLPLVLMRRQEAASAPNASAPRARVLPTPATATQTNGGIAFSAPFGPDRVLAED